jgi:malonyl CoA-acyl carrier protein transacylase
MQAMACSACICVGVHRITASTSGSARLSARSVATCDAVFVGHFLGLVKAATDQGDDFHAVDVLDAVQVLDAEGTSASQRYFDGLA